MSDKILRTITIILLIMILASLLVLISNFKIAKDSCEMRFNETKGNSNGIQGVWYYDDKEEYICAWVDKELRDTMDHELCHSIVFNDYNHFCYK